MEHCPGIGDDGGAVVAEFGPAEELRVDGAPEPRVCVFGFEEEWLEHLRARGLE